MKCKAIINLFNSDSQYICTISTQSSQIRFKPLNNHNQFYCDNQTDKNRKFVPFTAQTWSFWFFLNELNASVFYRKCVIKYVNELEGMPLVIIVQPLHEVIDRDWNSLTRHTAWEKVELDHLLSWLSTLGGAFSALGDSKSNCAEIAGKISFYQLKLGLQFGDPPTVVRSKLFVSLSLIQRGRLRLAKRIIRQQYEVAKLEEEYDPRLRKMCVGIWMKLQYAYQQRSQNRMPIRQEMCNKSLAADYLIVFLFIQKYRKLFSAKLLYSLINQIIPQNYLRKMEHKQHRILNFIIGIY